MITFLGWAVCLISLFSIVFVLVAPTEWIAKALTGVGSIIQRIFAWTKGLFS